MTTTDQAISLVSDERQRQKDIGTDGQILDRNGLIAASLAYLGRASEGVRRNESEGHDPKEMLVKAAAVIVDAIERCD